MDRKMLVEKLHSLRPRRYVLFNFNPKRLKSVQNSAMTMYCTLQ